MLVRFLSFDTMTMSGNVALVSDKVSSCHGHCCMVDDISIFLLLAHIFRETLFDCLPFRNMIQVQGHASERSESGPWERHISREQGLAVEESKEDLLFCSYCAV